MRRFLLMFAACLIAAVLLTPSAKAGTIVYSTLGPGGSYNCCNSNYTITGAGSMIGGPYSQAQPFTASWSSPITQIDLATGWVSGGDSFNIYLLSDNSGSPGSVITSWLGLPAASSFGSCCALSTVTGYISVTLGTTYWLEVQSAANDMWGTWNDNTSDTAPAYQIWAATTPEPSTLLLLLPGAALLLLRRRR